MGKKRKPQPVHQQIQLHRQDVRNRLGQQQHQIGMDPPVEYLPFVRPQFESELDPSFDDMLLMHYHQQGIPPNFDLYDNQEMMDDAEAVHLFDRHGRNGHQPLIVADAAPLQNVAQRRVKVPISHRLGQASAINPDLRLELEQKRKFRTDPNDLRSRLERKRDHIGPSPAVVSQKPFLIKAIFPPEPAPLPLPAPQSHQAPTKFLQAVQKKQAKTAVSAVPIESPHHSHQAPTKFLQSLQNKQTKPVALPGPSTEKRVINLRALKNGASSSNIQPPVEAAIEPAVVSGYFATKLPLKKAMERTESASPQEEFPIRRRLDELSCISEPIDEKSGSAETDQLEEGEKRDETPDQAAEQRAASNSHSVNKEDKAEKDSFKSGKREQRHISEDREEDRIEVDDRKKSRSVHSTEQRRTRSPSSERNDRRPAESSRSTARHKEREGRASPRRERSIVDRNRRRSSSPSPVPSQRRDRRRDPSPKRRQSPSRRYERVRSRSREKDRYRSPVREERRRERERSVDRRRRSRSRSARRRSRSPDAYSRRRSPERRHRSSRTRSPVRRYRSPPRRQMSRVVRRSRSRSPERRREQRRRSTSRHRVDAFHDIDLFAKTASRPHCNRSIGSTGSGSPGRNRRRSANRRSASSARSLRSLSRSFSLEDERERHREQPGRDGRYRGSPVGSHRSDSPEDERPVRSDRRDGRYDEQRESREDPGTRRNGSQEAAARGRFQDVAEQSPRNRQSASPKLMHEGERGASEKGRDEHLPSSSASAPLSVQVKGEDESSKPAAPTARRTLSDRFERMTSTAAEGSRKRSREEFKVTTNGGYESSGCAKMQMQVEKRMDASPHESDAHRRRESNGGENEETSGGPEEKRRRHSDAGRDRVDSRNRSSLKVVPIKSEKDRKEMGSPKKESDSNNRRSPIKFRERKESSKRSGSIDGTSTSWVPPKWGLQPLNWHKKTYAELSKENFPDGYESDPRWLLVSARRRGGGRISGSASSSGRAGGSRV